MVLIDAIFINGGGGKVLLDYLFKELSQVSDLSVTFLIDKRIEEDYSEKLTSNVNIIFLEGLKARNIFLKTNRNDFKKVLCFGNVPPNIKMSGIVYTYFHQLMYLEIPKEFSIIEKIKFRVKLFIIKMYLKNTNFWIVQNDIIKSRFAKKFNVSYSNVLKLPFYPPLESNSVVKRNRLSYIYVSNATPHKNHFNLIKAFCMFYDEKKVGSLVLTISSNYKEIFDFCNEKISEGYPIKNIGFVKRNDLANYYKENDFLIYPSLAESFGLGIVEAIDNGCNVIGADLPYLYEVCNPSIVFKPADIKSIYNSLCTSLNDEYPKTTKKITNEIITLIKLLKD